MQIKLPIILIFSALLQICKCQRHDSDLTVRKISDTVVKDIPLFKNMPVSGYQIKIEIASKLNLDFLEAGFDSLQIRFWYGNGSDTGQIIILKCSSGNWSAQLYLYKFHFNKNENFFDASILKSNEIMPKSGWALLIKKLFHLQVMTLPDEDKLKNYVRFFHSEGVAIEIASKKLYRFYRYHETQVAQHHIEEAKNVEKITELLESEFNFRRLQ